MDKSTFFALPEDEQDRYLWECTPEQLQELFENGTLDQIYYDMIREYRGILPEEDAERVYEEELKLRRQMAAFA